MGSAGTPGVVLVAAALAVACGGAPPRARTGPLDAAAIARRAVPAVVSIEADAERLGSGFFISADGRLVTNAHVVAGARRLRVILADGRVVDQVDLIDFDREHDVAILAIPGQDLPTLPLAARLPAVGTQVLAIGSPLGLDRTVSDGLISAVRTTSAGQMLQISAPISRGSSGGPVLDSRGRVVGVSTSGLEVGQNVNFAVPIHYAKALRTTGEPRPLGDLRDTARAAKVFARCSTAELRRVYATLSGARQRAVALVRRDRHVAAEASLRTAATDLATRGRSCGNVRQNLLGILSRAEALPAGRRRAARIHQGFGWLLGLLTELAGT
jgi:hypothetical protein